MDTGPRPTKDPRLWFPQCKVRNWKDVSPSGAGGGNATPIRDEPHSARPAWEMVSGCHWMQPGGDASARPMAWP